MANDLFNSFMSGPDEKGRFGDFGGRFVSETLMPLILDLEAEYENAKTDPTFWAEMDDLWKHYVGRPSPLYYAERITERLGGAKVYLKRDELNHTGAHKINNVLGQILLARRMGKTRIIAETGAGQHGVATATVCARFGLECIVYMGAHDVERQAPNVFRMRLLGAKVVPVTSGRGTLKDAMNDALRDWVTYVDNTFYCIGTVAGPHPYPAMVRDFQSIIGKEVREQMMEREGRLPDSVVAAIGGGSNAMGLFSGFINDEDVALYGVEPMGTSSKLGDHAATLTYGVDGAIHGFATKVLLDENGEPAPVNTLASGLDYPGVGPEHAHLQSTGRVTYTAADDKESLDAFYELSRREGIIPALESAHAVAFAMREAKNHPGKSILLNLSGRGDKDIDFVTETYGFGE